MPDDAFPRFNVNGYTALGSNNQIRDQTPIQQAQFTDAMSWIRGTHSLRFGGEARRSRNRDLRLQLVSGAFSLQSQRHGLNRNEHHRQQHRVAAAGFTYNFSASARRSSTAVPGT